MHSLSRSFSALSCSSWSDGDAASIASIPTQDFEEYISLSQTGDGANDSYLDETREGNEGLVDAREMRSKERTKTMTRELGNLDWSGKSYHEAKKLDRPGRREAKQLKERHRSPGPLSVAGAAIQSQEIGAGDKKQAAGFIKEKTSDEGEVEATCPEQMMTESVEGNRVLG